MRKLLAAACALIFWNWSASAQFGPNPYMTTAQPYVGQVAQSLMQNSFSASYNQANSRINKYARDNIASLQIAFCNWYGNSEAGPGAATTLTAAIEYPAGTIVQVKWSGATSQSIANGALGALSDPVVIAIPRGAMFWTRLYYQNTAGFSWYGANYATSKLNSQSEYAASGLTDKTMSGTISGTFASAILDPCLIVAPTTRPAGLIFGDSIELGTGDTLQDTSGDTGVIGRSIGPYYAYTKMAQGGETLAHFLAAYTQRKLLAPYFSFFIDQFGRNDFDSSATLASMTANMQTLAQTVYPGLKGYQATIEPRTTSTDTWATTANQTPDTNDTPSTVRTLVNQAIRQVIPYMYGYFDVTNGLETTTDTDIWNIGMVYTGDGLGEHPSTLGYQTVRKNLGISGTTIPR